MQLPAQIPTLPAEPYPLSAQEGDSAFWDRPISAGSSVPAAENRAKHMQPAMQDPSQAGPSSAASHATHGRGSLATPFADAAEQPLTDWSSSSAGAGPVQVVVHSVPAFTASILFQAYQLSMKASCFKSTVHQDASICNPDA